MGNEGKQNGYKDLKHKTILDLAPSTVEKEAAKNGHDGFMPTSVKVMKDGKQITRGNGNPTPSKGQRGRIATFTYTGERVTVLQERVGESYNGTPIHEVTTREGKIFLASENQLKALV